MEVNIELGDQISGQCYVDKINLQTIRKDLYICHCWDRTVEFSADCI